MEALAHQLLNLPESYDSDEAAGEEEQPVAFRQGMRQIKVIFENALENRTTSKRALKNHRPVAAAPSTQDQQQRWYNIFMAFFKTLNLPPATKPHADHVYRFMDVAARTLIRSGIRNKALPSLSSLQTGLRHLMAMLIEIHGFTATKQDAKRIESLFNKLVKEKVLFKGKWRKPNRVGFQTILYMADTWMSSGLKDGVLSWDIHISRQLSIVLIASFGSRCGEVVRSRLYTDMECICYKDLTISFVGGDDTQDLVMNVTLRFVKGYKDMDNVDRSFRVDALHSNAHNATCAVKMLLIQALRVGAVAAKSWSELKAQTLGRADKTVQWTTPDHPVIPALMGRSAFLDLAKPAIVQQPLRTINSMALKARFVNRFRVHDLRHGTLADLAHLDDQGKIRGHASMASAAAVGHKMSTFMADTTESYVGGSDAPTWTLRAESTWIDSRGPKIGHVPFIPRPFAPDELVNYCKSMKWDHLDEAKINRARHDLRVRDKEDWRAMCSTDAAPSVAAPPAAASKPALQPLAPKDINAKIAKRASSDEDKIDPFLLALPVPGKVLSQSTLSIPVTKSAAPILDALYRPWSDTVVSQYDPDILESDKALNEEEAENAQHLMGLIFGSSEDGQSAAAAAAAAEDLAADEEAEFLDALEDSPAQHAPDDPIHADADEFIKYFSSINVAKHTVLWDWSESKFNEKVEQYLPCGNSRDRPTRFVISCPNRIYGCPYTSSYGIAVAHHHDICTKTSVEATLASETPATGGFKCRKEGCGEEFPSKDTRCDHERQHNWTRKQCDLGCTDGAWFDHHAQWKRHRARYHDDRWDMTTTCPFPGCTRTDPFAAQTDLVSHLRWVHKLTRAATKQYLPPKPPLPTWGKRLCPFPDCVRAAPGATGFSNLQGMMRHLMGKKEHCHGMSEERATEVAKAVKMGKSIEEMDTVDS